MQLLRSIRNGPHDLCSALSKSCLMSSPLPRWAKLKLCGETLYKSLLESSSSSLASNAQGWVPDMWAKKQFGNGLSSPSCPSRQGFESLPGIYVFTTENPSLGNRQSHPHYTFWNPWSTECVIMGSLFYSGKCEVGLLCSNNTGIQRKYFIFYKSVQNLAPAYLFNICSNFLLTPYTQTNQVLFSDPTINQCIFTH